MLTPFIFFFLFLYPVSALASRGLSAGSSFLSYLMGAQLQKSSSRSRSCTASEGAQLTTAGSLLKLSERKKKDGARSKEQG